ncbi:MAG: hypothetical protein ABSA75_03275 [Candidatus Bathyarchaeia archaeon]
MKYTLTYANYTCIYVDLTLGMPLAAALAAAGALALLSRILLIIEDLIGVPQKRNRPQL